MLHRRDRQVDARHQPDLLRPQAGGIDHMLGGDGSLLGDQGPTAVGPRVQFQHPVAQDHLGAALLGGNGIGVGDAIGIQMALVGIVEAAIDAGDVGDRADLLDLFRRHQPGFLHAHGLEHRPGGFQPLPAFRRSRQVDAAGHMHADILAALLLQRLVEADGVALQRGDVRVGIDGVETRGRMPGGARRQLLALDQNDVLPAQLGQMIEDADADHAAADDRYAIMRFHGLLSPPAASAPLPNP